MEKFTPLAKILHCRRQWREWQIPPLGYDSSGGGGDVKEDYIDVVMWCQCRWYCWRHDCPQHLKAAMYLIPRSLTGAGPRSRSSFNLYNIIIAFLIIVIIIIVIVTVAIICCLCRGLCFYTLITTNTLGKFCWQSWGCRCWRGCQGWGWQGWATPSRRPRSSWGSAPSPVAPQMVLLSINIQIKSSTSALWRRSL